MRTFAGDSVVSFGKGRGYKLTKMEHPVSRMDTQRLA